MSHPDWGWQCSDVSLIKVLTIISILLDRINNSQNVLGKILISSLISYLSNRSNRIISGAVHDSDEDDDILMKTKLVWLIIMRIGGECSETQ